ncbi:MAG: ABC transporter substrate-binding protein [Thermoplasmata archaeon]
MSLNGNAPTPPTRPHNVSFAVFAVALLVVAGIAVAATAVVYTLKGPPSGGPISLTDDLGRSVTVPRDPSRVAVLSPSIMDSMYRLGLRSHVVGVDCYAASFGGLTADYSSDQISLWNLSQPMCIQIAPTLNVEALLNDSVQLVLASTIVSVADVEEIGVTYGIPVVMLQPPTLSGVEIDVSLIGEIFGVQSAATQLNNELAVRLASAAAIQANLTNTGATFPTVLVTYDTDDNGYWTYGPGTFGESLIELASATSIAANSTEPYPELSGETVLVADPTYLVYGTGFGLNLTSYQSAPFWSQLSATHDGNAVGVDSNYLTESDPTMILEGIPALLHLFHPGVTA